MYKEQRAGCTVFLYEPGEEPLIEAVKKEDIFVTTLVGSGMGSWISTDIHPEEVQKVESLAREMGFPIKER